MLASHLMCHAGSNYRSIAVSWRDWKVKECQDFMRRRKHEYRIDLADLESDTFSFRVPVYGKRKTTWDIAHILSGFILKVFLSRENKNIISYT